MVVEGAWWKRRRLSDQADHFFPPHNATFKRPVKTLTHQKAKPSRPNQEKTKQRNRRICNYLALVEPIAHFYAKHSPEPLEDLRQVGLLGLLRASELYEPKRKIAFEAFARPHIRGAMLHYLRDGAPAIRLPRTVVELRQRDPSSLNEAQLGRLELVAGMQRPLSLDSHPGISLEEIEEAPSMNRFNDSGCPGGVGQGAEATQGDALTELARLEPKLRTVVRQVVLAGWSYRRTAQKLGVSPMTVQRRLKRGLVLLKTGLSGAGIPLDLLLQGAD